MLILLIVIIIQRKTGYPPCDIHIINTFPSSKKQTNKKTKTKTKQKRRRRRRKSAHCLEVKVGHETWHKTYQNILLNLGSDGNWLCGGGGGGGTNGVAASGWGGVGGGGWRRVWIMVAIATCLYWVVCMIKILTTLQAQLTNLLIKGNKLKRTIPISPLVNRYR